MGGRERKWEGVGWEGGRESGREGGREEGRERQHYVGRKGGGMKGNAGKGGCKGKADCRICKGENVRYRG